MPLAPCFENKCKPDPDVMASDIPVSRPGYTCMLKSSSMTGKEKRQYDILSSVRVLLVRVYVVWCRCRSCLTMRTGACCVLPSSGSVRRSFLST